MFRGSLGKKLLFSTSIFILVVAYSLTLLILNSDMLAATPLMAAPLAQNPYSECPPNSSDIWIRLDTNFIDQPRNLAVPFDSGQITIEGNVYVNYLLGVLISEIGPTTDFTPVDDETIRAMAIAARTVTYRNCGCELIPNNNDCSLSIIAGHRGMDDDAKQFYDPRRRNIWLGDPSLG